MDWIDLAQYKGQWSVFTVMNLRIPQKIEKFLRSCATGGSSRSAEHHGVS
jgi:hypothetical protein